MSWMHEYPPCVFTDAIPATREFYSAHFEAEVLLDLGWYLSLQVPGCTQTLRFLQPQPPAQHQLNRPGLTYNLAVRDIEDEYRRVHSRGLQILTPLQMHPWGDRAFWLADPNGILFYIFAESEPSAEFLAALRMYG